MSYWDDDAQFLRDLARELASPEILAVGWAAAVAQRLQDIAHDLDRAAPDGPFLEGLADSIERWANEGVVATREYAERLGDELRALALALKRDPSQ